MRFLPIFALVCGLVSVSGCSPALNWREVRPEQTSLLAMFPCKPDQGIRPVTLGGKDLQLKILACEADGTNFTLAYADIGKDGSAGDVLAEWQKITLGQLHVSPAKSRPFLPQGATVLTQSVQLELRRSLPDGGVLNAAAVWFARGAVVFQATVSSTQPVSTDLESYFGGLQFQ